MTDRGSVEEFLGIKVNSLDDGSYKLTQEDLLDKILKTTNMENCNPAVDPTSGPKSLGPDPHDKVTASQRSPLLFINVQGTSKKQDLMALSSSQT
eukprot:1632904-Ditylum_brightwellii.AAC.1